MSINGPFVEYTLTKEELAELKSKLKPSDGKKPSGLITKREQAKGSKSKGG